MTDQWALVESDIHLAKNISIRALVYTPQILIASFTTLPPELLERIIDGIHFPKYSIPTVLSTRFLSKVIIPSHIGFREILNRYLYENF